VVLAADWWFCQPWLMTEPQSYEGRVAAQIDRLVIACLEAAGADPNQPEAFLRLKARAQPALLTMAGVILAERAIGRDDIVTMQPYLSPKLMNALVDNNITGGVVVEGEGGVALTEAGVEAAAAVVDLQDTAAAAMWAGTDLDAVESVSQALVERGSALPPLDHPAAFPLFAAVCARPTQPGRVLRLITALRYWRADAHRAAVKAAGFRPREAQALNTLWDRERALVRLGQGLPDPGHAVTVLEERGLAADGAITTEGMALRERIERDTDHRTAPLYEEFDQATKDGYLVALSTLPGKASPSIPGT
jgi:hypothetical protein